MTRITRPGALFVAGDGLWLFGVAALEREFTVEARGREDNLRRLARRTKLVCSGLIGEPFT